MKLHLPEDLIRHFRAALILKGKTVRQFAREIGQEETTVRRIIGGARGMEKDAPSAKWVFVMKSARPYLPAAVSRDVERAIRAYEQGIAPKKRGTP